MPLHPPTPRTGWRWRPVLVAAAVATAALLASCGSLAKVVYLEVLPLRGFQTHPADPQVHFEPGAEAAADAVVAGLDDAVRQIETSHGAPLHKRPAVYLCATAACYERYAFTVAARAETRPFGNTVLMQGRLLVDEQRLMPILTHELSHAFWFQRGIRCLPRWWTEGLAVDASGGGGAELAPPATALQAVHEGRLFTELDESCTVRDSATRAQLEWPLFYREAGMFVGWLRERDGAAFARTLAQLRDGTGLPTAITSSYAAPPLQLWQAWRRDLEQAAR